jgi:restriction system protein
VTPVKSQAVLNIPVGANGSEGLKQFKSRVNINLIRGSRQAMARSFFSTVAQAARQAERARRQQERALIRLNRETGRQIRQLQKEERQAYFLSRQEEVEAENERLREQIEALQSILKTGLTRDPIIEFHRLVRLADESELDKVPELIVPPEPNYKEFEPTPPSALIRWLPWVKKSHEIALKKARICYAAAKETRRNASEKRSARRAALQTEADTFNANLKALFAGYEVGDPIHVGNYLELVLQRSPYPDGFLQIAQAAYVKESLQLVVDFELPEMGDIVPDVEKFRYVKAQDAANPVKRSAKARASLYADALAQAVLRSVDEVYHSDTKRHVQSIVLNAHVETVAPGTGNLIRPCLVTVRTTRDEFLALNLAQVDPLACLKQLKASVSRQPDELVPVKPILEFNMVDPRFIEGADVLSTIDNRPNLMELSPGEFEALITNLFTKMGLETKLTRPSRDGGVDCVAYDQRPILGGKVVIQAKRYKNTVGVSAVRDLFGTMHNEGASKGILVTTSGYGIAAFEFANNKPIELITGSNLLYLLREHANVDARIEAPPDWVDPRLE